MVFGLGRNDEASVSQCDILLPDDLGNRSSADELLQFFCGHVPAGPELFPHFGQIGTGGIQNLSFWGNGLFHPPFPIGYPGHTVDQRTQGRQVRLPIPYGCLGIPHRYLVLYKGKQLHRLQDCSGRCKAPKDVSCVVDAPQVGRLVLQNKQRLGGDATLPHDISFFPLGE